MLKHTNSFLLLLCIFLTLPFQALSVPSPTVTCHQRNSPIDKVFQQDCRNLIQKQILGGRGPLSSATGWEEKSSASSQTESIWSASSGSCVLGFSAQRPLSHETWNAIKSSIHAVVDECLDHKQPGGRRLQLPLRISRRGGLTAEEEKTLRELNSETSKSVKKVVAAYFGVILWRRHGRWHPRLGAGVLFGSATLFGQGLGGLATSVYGASNIQRGATSPGQSGSRDDELRRRSFEGDYPVYRLYPRAGADTKSSKVTYRPAPAALGRAMMPANPTVAAELYAYGAMLGMQGSRELDRPTNLPDARRVQTVSHLTVRGLGDRLSRHFLIRRLCRAVRFRRASRLTEREKRIKRACWQVYGGSAWAAAGVGMVPVEPRLAAGVFFAGAALAVHGAKGLHDVTRAPANPLRRRSYSSSVSASSPPALHHHPSNHPPNHPAPPPSTHSLHRRGLCREVLWLNPLWLTHDQKEMRSACLKMIASTAALTAGGWVGTRTKFHKVAVGMTAWGALMGVQGAKQFATAKLYQYLRPMVTPSMLGLHDRRRSLGGVVG